jgi:vacuolar protein sorting-associated protein 13A/C
MLQASLFKSGPLSEKRLGDLRLEGFALTFGMTDYVMQVGVQLQ